MACHLKLTMDLARWLLTLDALASIISDIQLSDEAFLACGALSISLASGLYWPLFGSPYNSILEASLH